MHYTYKYLSGVAKSKGFIVKRSHALKSIVVDPQQSDIPSELFNNVNKALEFVRDTKIHPLADALQDIRRMVACQERQLTDAEKYVLRKCAEVL